MSLSMQLQPAEGTRLQAATPQDIAAILDVERAAYPLPWTWGNFNDILTDSSGRYHMLLLREQQADGSWRLIGYFVALLGVEEVHLLNIAIHPERQGRGWAQLLLEHLRLWALAQEAHQIWLEVRQSNPRAHAIYQHFGYVDMGVRKNYYPTPDGKREHADVMCLAL